jgi:hypothetical protein
VGKTVLLMELDVLASEAGWATTDVQEVGTNADFRATFARMAARLLVNMSRRHRAKQRIERVLAVVKAFSIAIPGAVDLKFDVEGPRASPIRAIPSRISPTSSARSVRWRGPIAWGQLSSSL